MPLDRDDIALSLGVHPRTYIKWENGESDPSLSKALEIAKILKSSLGELLGQASMGMTDAGNNNKQEGENVLIQNSTVSFDRETMQEINQRFAFLERMLAEEREEKKMLIARVMEGKQE